VRVAASQLAGPVIAALVTVAAALAAKKVAHLRLFLIHHTLFFSFRTLKTISHFSS
jgi:hypothetical protein